MGFEVEVAGVVETRERLRKLVDELGDMEDLWAKYAEVMSAGEAEWFASNGEGAWPPLAHDTVREKERGGWPPETLVRTGALVESLTDPGQAMSVSQGRSTLGTFTSSEMVWGTSVADDRGREYAHYHQHTEEGSMIDHDYGGRPPLRQVIPQPLPAAWQSAMLDADDAWVRECLEKSGLE
jgi:hypothetical protein